MQTSGGRADFYRRALREGAIREKVLANPFVPAAHPIYERCAMRRHRRSLSFRRCCAST